MLTKQSDGTAKTSRLSQAVAGVVGGTVDRRTFLKRSSIAAGGVAVASAFGLSMTKKSKAAPAVAMMPTGGQSVLSVCNFCAVGCTIKATVQSGVWTRQEPAFDSPINNGSYCAKGAAAREETNSHRRLKYPMKLVGGKWKKISWDQAVDEIGDKILDIRKKSGPDSVYWLGSAKHSNEQCYLMRKFAGFWGSNNIDHQARICHSTTVAGVANTWGYGAMTNSYPDMRLAKAMITIGGNPAEAHPVAMQHMLTAKERNNAPFIVVDPRFTRTAAHATEHVQHRPGTDIPVIWGILYHIFKNGWEDKQYINDRVFAMDEIRQEVAKWTPEEVERVSGVPGAQLERVARLLAENKPATLTWALGITQHTIGNSNTRALCILQLALGNVGTSGGGTNIMRGHDNVQGATDMGVLCHDLPGYYGIAKGSWSHWARVWGVSYDYLKDRFASEKLMHTPGTPVSRWYELVLMDKKEIQQPDNVKAMIFWGHSINSTTRLNHQWEAFNKLELVVVVDPYVPVAAVMGDRKDGTYLLPATSQFETSGSVTASNRSLQWRDRIVKPVFESKVDHEIMYLFATKLGFGKEMFKNIKINGTEPLVEDITREFNRGMWTIGYTGQSPERLKAHMQHQATFDKVTLKANGGPLNGEYYGLPWPCWGTAAMKHTGTPNLYDTSKPVAEGGLCFRARFGVTHDGKNLLAEGSYPVGSEIKDGYPEFTMAMLKKLGWDKDLTPEETATIEKIGGDKCNWKVDLSGGIQRVAIKHGCAPFGNAKARCEVWGFPDPIPIHREPLYTPRRDLVAKYPTFKDTRLYRLPIKFESIQIQDFSKDFPLVLTSGCLVEHEGGGAKTRANPWLAEIQPDMFIQMNPFDANNAGVKEGQMVSVEGPEGGKIEAKLWVTDAVGRGVVFMPYHWGERFNGHDIVAKYPDGTGPYVYGGPANAVLTYGYDIVTNIQEDKVSLCRVRSA
jgi:formate dehydrogenase major subunit